MPRGTRSCSRRTPFSSDNRPSEAPRHRPGLEGAGWAPASDGGLGLGFLQQREVIDHRVDVAEALAAWLRLPRISTMPRSLRNAIAVAAGGGVGGAVDGGRPPGRRVRA